VTYQSLYRRYRPQRFSELVGQDHVVRALRNAVRDDRVVHAYLFSGPRGCGKTSTARILGKALNCENLEDGEPCGKCDSCRSIEAGTSYDVHELDAASNNGVDAMRDLVERTALGTAGRRKVYILDEVHMLSKGAEAALLKTLEEPPSHVVFVLATTDPQKVSSTVSSRCQPLDFHLLPTDALEAHVRYVIADAHLDVSEEAIEAVLRRGGGSARDTLSALDQVVVTGGVSFDAEPLDEIIEALIDRDTARALAAVALAAQAGRDVRTISEHLVAQLRDAFLSLMAPNLVQLPDRAAERVADQGKRLGAANTVRAMEVLGEMLVELRHAPDPRLMLDVALVRLVNAEADTSPAALLARLERLEKAAAGGVPAATPTPAPIEAPPVLPTTGPASARAALGSRARSAEPAPTPAAAAPPPQAPPAPPAAGTLPTRDELTVARADAVVPKLKGMAKALFLPGRFVGEVDGRMAFAVANDPHRKRAEPYRAEVEATLAAHFGRPVPLTLVLDEGQRGAPVERTTAPSADDGDEAIDPAELVDARPQPSDGGIERLTRAFPGAEVIEEDR
jgi:DNA polymerase-3 subunit gamma/tau